MFFGRTSKVWTADATVSFVNANRGDQPWPNQPRWGGGLDAVGNEFLLFKKPQPPALACPSFPERETSVSCGRLLIFFFNGEPSSGTHCCLSEKKQGHDRMIELLWGEWRVAECNALIEHQRQPIEQLGNKGRDITSAQIVFDSLLVSLKEKRVE